MNRLEKLNLQIPSFKIDNSFEEKRSSKDLSLSSISSDKNREAPIVSRFNFIKAHEGLQRGHVHVLLGRTNKGKSALLLELLLESARNDQKVLIFLSETKRKDLKDQIDDLRIFKKIDDTEYKQIKSRIFVATEEDFTGNYNESPEVWINALMSFQRKYKCALLIVDNITGIKYGNADPSEQVRFIKYLNTVSQSLDVATVIAVHQAKSVDSMKELEIHDVRANQNFTSIPSYVYALNDFCNLSREKRVIKILKSRNHGKAIDRYFELEYKPVGLSGHYTKDREIPKQMATTAFLNNRKLVQNNFKKY